MSEPKPPMKEDRERVTGCWARTCGGRHVDAATALLALDRYEITVVVLEQREQRARDLLSWAGDVCAEYAQRRSTGPDISHRICAAIRAYLAEHKEPSR